MASSHNTFISREEYRTKKALDELRKAGKMPAELDEEGKEINPHMPQYIIQAPWYLNQSQPSLKHHRQRQDILRTKLEEWYPRGSKTNNVVTKYRKGACENCGAMTHKVKDCFDRPRGLAAKFSGKDLQQDEMIREIQLDYDAKRDRWNGYDPDMYSDVIKEYEEYDAERKKKKQKELDENREDDYKIGDFDNTTDLQVPQKDPKTKTTIRNLRIREDPAKYLFNLDENSAHYDPKTRAMRENPNPNSDTQIFKGDNSYRYTGDTVNLLEQEKFAWELIENNNAELNTIGLPSGTEMLYRKMKEKEKENISNKTKELISKYGGDDHFKPDEGIIFAQTEKYTEYGRDGKMKNLFDKLRGKSRYEEDKSVNNHTAVWGSWWNEELGWGFACCHSNEKQSLCMGDRGKVMALKREFHIKKKKEDDLKQTEEKLIIPEIIEEKAIVDHELEKKNLKIFKNSKQDKKKIIADSSSSDSSENDSDSSSSSSSSSESDKSNTKRKEKKLKEKEKKKEKINLRDMKNPFQDDLDNLENLDKKKLKKALKSEQKNLRKAEDLKDDRKRPYNSSKANYDISKEEIEAYRMKKVKIDDPLYQMKN